jgi:hypothetical protein
MPITMGHPFLPLKPAEGFGSYEFADLKEAYEAFVAPALQAGEAIFVQPKWDGVRLVVHFDGERVFAFTEDKRRDRAPILPALVEGVKAQFSQPVILDGEILLGREVDGKFVPRMRPNMMVIVVGKEPITDPIRYRAFDLLYLGEEDWTERPYQERYRKLTELLSVLTARDDQILSTTPSIVLAHEDYDTFSQAVQWAVEFPGSEGAMFKIASSPYELDGRTTLWAKYKRWKALKAKIIGISKVFPPGTEEREWKEAFRRSRTYLFRCAVLGPDNRTLIPIESKRTITESDLTLRKVHAGETDPVTGQVASKTEWRGRDDPRLWTMDEAFPHRQPGEFAYGQTYAIKVEEGEPRLGDLVEVAPIALNWFADDDGFVHLTWMHPRVISVGTDDPAEVATWERVTELILASGQDAPSVVLEDGRLRLVEASAAVTGFVAREASQKRPVVKARLITQVPKIGLPRQVLRAAWLLAPKDFRVFVDLFCGVTGSFLRVKPREIGEKEVLIDKNWDVIRVLKLVQSGEWRKLQRYRWYPISRRFIEEAQAELQDRMRRGDTSLRRTYLWLLALQFSDSGYPEIDKRLNFNRLNYEYWNKRAVERFFARFAEWEERLQGVVIRQMDAFKAMEHYDSKDTFFFADPPWNDPDDTLWYNTEFPFRDFLNAAASLKGRILILLDPGYLGVARELGLRYRRLVYEAWLFPGHDLDAELSEAVGERRQRRLLYLLGNYDLPRLRKELIAQRSLPEEEEMTHEEQRLEEERRLGDPFKVIHDTQDYPDGYPAVYMRHYRGLWSPEEADAVSELLDRLIRTRSAEERQDLWREITKKFGAFALTDDFDRVAQAAQDASGKRGDVSKTIESFLTDDLEEALASVQSASELRERLVNLASVHGDLRIVDPAAPKRQLIGWTVMTPAVAVQFTDGNIVPVLRDKFLFYQPGDRLIVVKKARQPIVWLDVVNPDKPLLWAPPAAAGATAHRWALFEWHAFLRVWFGIQRPDYHEFFFQFDDLADDDYTLEDGKWVARYLPGKGEKIGKEGAYWQFWRPEKEGQLPYLLSHTPSQAKREWKGRHYEYVITNSQVVPIVLDAFSDIAELAPEEDQVRERLREWDETFPP